MNYEEMLEFVKKTLEETGGIKSLNPLHKFRNRFDHCKRVYEWCKIIHNDLECDVDVLYTAAIFHDVGRGLGAENHAHLGAEIFLSYAKSHSFNSDFTKKVYDLIDNHSDKSNITNPNSSNELVLLLEADLLDEEGALGITWDLMALGAKDDVTYYDANEALRHAKHILKQDYMVTPRAKAIWEHKKKLVLEFTQDLTQDLFLEDEYGIL